jgi:hypothetical protein
MIKKIKLYLHKFYWYKLLTNKVHKNAVLRNPKAEASRAYYTFFKKYIDWENPIDLIEKISWLQFNTDTSLWTKCADKYLVRNYIKELGYKDHLPKLYGKWDNVEEIDFSKLPEKFVLKANNGCGTVLIVKNKEEINIKKTRRKLKRWLSLPFGYSGAQLHYLKIKPCIIAEELLENNKEDIVISPNSLIDYKIWCFSGVPEAILVTYDRTNNGLFLTLYDTDWREHPEYILPSSHYRYKEIDIPKPKCLNEMFEISAKLSKQFNQVRIDFYVINNKPYVGEMTFSTGFGYFTKDYYNYLGSKIDISQINISN